MIFKTVPFEKLTIHQLHDLYKLRAEVFVVEQNCVYLDLDGKDKLAIHVLGYEGDELAAYARVLPKGSSYNEVSIGRVATGLNHRGKILGRALMEKSIQTALEAFQTNEILISAQAYLEKFYQSLGFITEGSTYLEDNIPHIKMRLKK